MPTTLGPQPTARAYSVRVIGDVLWITNPLGEGSVTYCADPRTGRPRVRLPPLPGDSVLLAAGEGSIYYTYVPVNAHAVRLERAPIDPACS